MSHESPPTRRWTRIEYERMVEREIFRPDDRIELVDGHLFVKEPPHPSHATTVQLVAEALRGAFGAGWTVRTGLPLGLDDVSEPEPDVAVVRGSPRDYAADHPSQPVLVVEVSHSRLRFDRTRKRQLYARNGVPEYWIVDVNGRVLQVFREPGGAGRSATYRSVAILGPDAFATPLAASSTASHVSDLLP
ncbi:MAG: Uma2 family endonuclease [Candidatus Rokubacteria bacterium]|nr:Uma2 family endonuclease [Candidatus Rokubacteria bacterium]MBI3824634.1 Uma2 family endonuclease [Candidatus Rokubacteria bacterium]